MTKGTKTRIQLYGCEAGTPLFDSKEQDTELLPSFSPSLKSISFEANDLIPVITKETQAEKVYEAIRLGVRVNDRQIHVITGIERFLIPDRRARLLARGRIRFAGKFIDPVTHKTTATWEINR
jgi:hypothetical protein